MIFRYGVGLALMYAVASVLRRLLCRPLQERGVLSPQGARLLAHAILYLPGMSLLWLMIRRVPRQPVDPLSWQPWQYFILFATCGFSIPLMVAATLIEATLQGKKLETLETKETGHVDTAWDVVILLLVAPVMEEIFTRTFLYHRLAGEHLGLFVAYSAFCFGIIHGVTGEIATVIGNVYTGIMFALAYAASGSIWLPFLYHMAYNLFIVFIPDRLERQGKVKIAHGWLAGLSVSGIGGFVVLWLKGPRFIPVSRRAPAQEVGRTIFSNPGTWILMATMLILYQIVRQRKKRRDDATPDASRTLS